MPLEPLDPLDPLDPVGFGVPVGFGLEPLVPAVPLGVGVGVGFGIIYSFILKRGVYSLKPAKTFSLIVLSTPFT